MHFILVHSVPCIYLDIAAYSLICTTVRERMFVVFATARAHASQEIGLRLHRNFYLYFTLFLSHLGAMLALLCI